MPVFLVIFQDVGLFHVDLALCRCLNVGILRFLCLLSGRSIFENIDDEAGRNDWPDSRAELPLLSSAKGCKSASRVVVA